MNLETRLGAIVGSKIGTTEVGQIAGAVFMAVMFGTNMPLIRNQKIESLILDLLGKEKQICITLQGLCGIHKDKYLMYREYFWSWSVSWFF